MIRVLVVDDDPDLRDLTAYALRRERFVVTEAKDGAEALHRWEADRPDLMVLDLGLPATDGFDVLRRVRERDTMPVLVVTGRAEAHDRLRTFGLGADDFITKPFEFRELVARIRAILRRAKGAAYDETEPAVQIDGLRLSPETDEVSWDDASVRFTPTEFRILYMLVTNAGHVVPASRLYNYVWGGGGADANALRSHISHIRRKLERGDGLAWSITAIPAVGYIFRGKATGGVATTAAALELSDS